MSPQSSSGRVARGALGAAIATAVALAALVAIGVISWDAVRGFQGVGICGALGAAVGAALGGSGSRLARVLGGGIGGVVAGYFALASGEVLAPGTAQWALGGAGYAALFALPVAAIVGSICSARRHRAGIPPRFGGAGSRRGGSGRRRSASSDRRGQPLAASADARGAVEVLPGRHPGDGSFRGEYPLLPSSMELALDRSFDHPMVRVIPTIRASFEGVIQHLRPPKYPYAIDRELAERGRALFYSKEIGCVRCHDVYDGQGKRRWTGLHVDVGTDRARREMVGASFVDSFRASPITEHGDLVPSRGYAATPLNGAWANYPYPHNGSVPTVWHLLGPSSERPRIFSVQAARRLDRRRLGQTLTSSDEAEVKEDELIERHGKRRDWFSVVRPGCGNGGHEFWPVIRTDENRRALIEYLKTL